MTLYVHISDDGAQGYPLTLPDIRFANPNVSFPPQPSEEDVAPFGYHAVRETEPPTASIFQTTQRSGAALIDGEWVEQWSVSEWSDEQIAAATEAEWSAIRSDRNQRLADCDWTQLPDAPVEAAAWATYRQALRDMTDQPDPFTVIWPNAPLS